MEHECFTMIQIPVCYVFSLWSWKHNFSLMPTMDDASSVATSLSLSFGSKKSMCSQPHRKCLHIVLPCIKIRVEDSSTVEKWSFTICMRIAKHAEFVRFMFLPVAKEKYSIIIIKHWYLRDSSKFHWVLLFYQQFCGIEKYLEKALTCQVNLQCSYWIEWKLLLFLADEVHYCKKTIWKVTIKYKHKTSSKKIKISLSVTMGVHRKILRGGCKPGSCDKRNK